MERTNVQIQRIICALTTAFIAIALMIAAVGIAITPTTANADTPQAGSWVKQSGKWWYKYADGTYPANTQVTIKGATYSFDAKGWMKTGWKLEDGSWYYYKSSGAMATGWQKVKGTWYYLNADGKMATGWKQVDGTWYYLKASGAMKTGWLQDGSDWYYLKSSGAMATGWAKVKGSWYYLDTTSGKMKTGFYQVGSKTYYSNASGKMLTGWQKISGKWYYFDNSGAAKTNAWISGTYWVGSDGAMVTSGWVDNGNYYVDGSGKYVKNPSASQLATKPGNNNASSSHVHSFTDEYVWQGNVGKPVHSWPAYFAWTSPGNRPLFSNTEDASYVASAAGYNHGFYGNFSIKKCSCGKYQYTYNGIETDVNHLCTLDVITLKATNNETSSTLTTTVPSHPCPTCNRIYSFDELKDETPHNYIYAEVIEEHVKRELRIGDPYLPATDPAVTTYSIDGEVVSHATYIETLKKYAQMCGLLTE